MGSQLSKLDTVGAEAGRAARAVLIAALLAVHPMVAVAALLIGWGDGVFAPVVVDSPAVVVDSPAVVVDSPAVVALDLTAAELSDSRWQAMAKPYEGNGLLLGDAAVSEAADQTAESCRLQPGFYLPDGLAQVAPAPEALTEPYWLQARTFVNRTGQASEADTY